MMQPSYCLEQGVPTIRRAVINIKESDDYRGKKGDKELLVEGYGLQKVMTTQGPYKIHTQLWETADPLLRYRWRVYHIKSHHRGRPGLGYRSC